MLGRITVGLILILLVGYGVYEGLPLLLGPRIVLDSPTQDMNVPDGVLTVSGKVSRAAGLALDGAPVLPDEAGAFSSTLAFPRGSSILTLTARDRFGRTVSLSRTIFVP